MKNQNIAIKDCTRNFRQIVHYLFKSENVIYNDLVEEHRVFAEWSEHSLDC